MNAGDTLRNTATDASEQIRELRAQVESLMRDRVTPAVSQAAGRAQDFARDARHIAEDQATALQGRVREQPLLAVAVAAGIGYLIGRISR
jgi:ElaB/YqjD/DUF883 family membrane-anchored ribosome-binding protein